MGKKGKSYDDVVSQIYGRQKFTGRMSLEPITKLMERLDNPHRDVPMIHVAGTNGKGSTTTMIAAILEAAGYRVGTYTSPHLTDFRERIQVNGEPVTAEQVQTYYEEIVAQDIQLSFFECTTALAFIHFAEEDVDVAVIETGLGGRLDATNIVTPELSIITNVARDHTKWLGETPEQIAYEKAGIIKDGVPVLSGAVGAPQNVIEAVADQRQADLFPVEQQTNLVQERSQGMIVELDGVGIQTPILGVYQLQNMDTAITACNLLDGFTVSPQHVEEGLTSVQLEGRMERIANHPLVLFEGAHNPAGMKEAARSIQRMQNGKTITVVSIMGDKDYPGMMKRVEEFSDLIILSEAEMDRAADPHDLAACIQETDYEIQPDVRQTWETALELAGDDDTIVFTGSLYFIGDVKKTLDEMWC